MGSSTAYIVPLTPNHSENPVASDSAMGRFVILLLCLAYFSWPKGCMGSGTGVSGGTRGSGLGQLVKEFNEKNKKWFSLKCPSGESFSVEEGSKPEDILRNMKSSCERRPPYCPYDVDNPELDCSAAEGLLKEYDVEAACIIHDLCYMQFGDTDKRRCDNDFHHNMKELCSHPWWSFLPFKFGIPIPIAAVVNCPSVTDIAYYAVRDKGNSNTNFHKNSRERKCRNEYKKSPAPVNGSWGSWSSWSSCDTDCGSGTRYRTRNCNGQKNGGKYCNGSRRESKTCSNSRKCSGSSGSKEWYEERDWSNFGGGFL